MVGKIYPGILIDRVHKVTEGAIYGDNGASDQVGVV